MAHKRYVIFLQRNFYFSNIPLKTTTYCKLSDLVTVPY